MVATLETGTETSPKSFSLNSLKHLQGAMRISMMALVFANTVLLWPRTLPAQHTPPNAREVEAFAERARSERQVGKKAGVPTWILNELMAGIRADIPYCDSKDRNDLEACEVPRRSNLPGVLAIQGQGGCFCSPTGNCAFWIYQLKNGKYHLLLETDMVQVFGFLKSQTHGYPDLVTWSHGSATMFGAQLFRFNGDHYVASGAWEEDYEYLGADGQIVRVAKPRITSYFTSEDQLPK
jgi:hypothetical protein